MKRILSLFLVIAVFFSPSGCAKSESAEDKKTRVISEATAYLKENYPDDEFTYISGRSPNWAYTYYELGFSSKNYHNKEFSVFGVSNGEKNDEGLTKITYSDDYYKYYMIEDAEKYFYDTAKEYLGKDIVVKVSVQGGLAAAEKIQNNKSFIDNLTNDSILPFVYIFGLNNYQSEEDKIKEFLSYLVNEKIGINFTYLYVENQKEFLEISEKELDDIKDGDKYENKFLTTFKGKINDYDKQ